ncbi:MAG: hypothetical protein MJ252_21155, partial [archaeon]|nr:hypothetical protein [archaeon]
NKSQSEDINNQDNQSKRNYKNKEANSSIEYEENEEEEDEDKDNIFLQISPEIYKDFDFIYFDLKDFNESSKYFSYKNLSKFYNYLKGQFPIEIITNFLNFYPSLNKPEQMAYLYNILSLTSVYIFENNTANKFFNSFYTYKIKEQEKTKKGISQTAQTTFFGCRKNSMRKSKSSAELSSAHFSHTNYRNDKIELYLNKKSTIDFFLNDIIKSCPYNYFQKIALFLDDFNTSYVIHLSPCLKIRKVYDYDARIFPKINHYNTVIVNEYQKLIKRNFNEYSQIYTNTFIGSIVYNYSNINQKSLFTGYLLAIESTKKIMELHKNGLEIPTRPEFFIVKLPMDKIEKLIENTKLKEKESKFTLDCLNLNNVKWKNYNSLFDKNMNSFFHGTYLSDLKSNGLINKKGYIFYDSNYKDCFAPHSNKKIDQLTEKDLIRHIKKINVGDNLLNKEVNVIEKVLNMNLATNKKIPIVGHSNIYSARGNTTRNSLFVNKSAKSSNLFPRIKSSLNLGESKNYRSKRKFTPSKKYNLSSFRSISSYDRSPKNY